jgi:hypothetical protein
MTTFFTIKDGSVLNQYSIMKALELPDGNYQMEIKKKGRRSIPLNNYYWGGVVEQQREGFKSIGYDWSKEQVHEFNKAEFNYTEIINPATGEIKRAPRTTTDLSNSEFKEFIERIKIFSAEWLNTYILDPNQQTAIAYE